VGRVLALSPSLEYPADHMGTRVYTPTNSRIVKNAMRCPYKTSAIRGGRNTLSAEPGPGFSKLGTGGSVSKATRLRHRRNRGPLPSRTRFGILEVN
jgi:hypothetical protein